jgi:hypothetical protein
MPWLAATFLLLENVSERHRAVNSTLLSNGWEATHTLSRVGLTYEAKFFAFQAKKNIPNIRVLVHPG